MVKLVQRRTVSEKVLAGTEIPGGGRRGRPYLSLHCHHQNDSCVKMGSDGSHFDVSLIVRDNITGHCSQEVCRANQYRFHGVCVGGDDFHLRMV